MEYALLFCNGVMPDATSVRHLAMNATRIVCADGGAKAARKFRVRPDVILGDLDSLSNADQDFFKRSKVPIYPLKRQSDTDLEKALLHIIAHRCTTVVILGATGNRTDHTLGNFSVLARYSQRLRIILFDPDYRIDLVTASKRFECAKGERLSLIALTPTRGITTKGLRYKLTDGVLATGTFEGTSNEAISDIFTVTFTKGKLLVFREFSPKLLSI